ncbi:MAG: RDD family protein [Candidatus Moraniibacteriota bacterium]
MSEPLKKLDIDLDFLDKKDPITKPVVEGRVDEKKSNPDSVTTVRPWIRYWARSLDVIVFSLIFGVFLGIFIPSLLETSDTFLTLLILFVWIFAEAALLNTWGTTPGKWLLRVNLKSPEGSKLEFSKALNRSFAVWFRGLGLGIPIVSLFTLSSAYSYLNKEGATTWDKDGHFTVTHEKIGFIRATVAIIIVIIFLLLIISGE